MAACLGQWLDEVREAGGREITIDGKTICGSGSKGKGKKAAPMVSAWVGARDLVLGQVAMEEKSNEITAIPELLDRLEVTGDTITIDAMGCQREIAEKIREKGWCAKYIALLFLPTIIRLLVILYHALCQARHIFRPLPEKGADYVLSVKENQPETYREVKEYFEYIQEGREKELPQEGWRSGLEKGHGRIERREVWSEEELGWMNCKGNWKDLKTIIQYRCTRTEGEKTTVSTP